VKCLRFVNPQFFCGLDNFLGQSKNFGRQLCLGFTSNSLADHIAQKAHRKSQCPDQQHGGPPLNMEYP
jgi:hypothetical protein